MSTLVACPTFTTCGQIVCVRESNDFTHNIFSPHEWFWTLQEALQFCWWVQLYRFFHVHMTRCITCLSCWFWYFFGHFKIPLLSSDSRSQVVTLLEKCYLVFSIKSWLEQENAISCQSLYHFMQKFQIHIIQDIL